jgi:ABC-type multidrug transport system fused ATPase/permease subunit
MIYGSPLEIVVCVSFLYSLLGPSAFAGFFVLLLAMPANHFLSTRSYAIQKVLLAARDKRLNVLNELIGAIKFIKFFAWERQWEERVGEARNEELKVMIKGKPSFVSCLFA